MNTNSGILSVVPRAPVLQVRDVSKSYSGICVLDRACLEVYGGTIHALVGANGAGKSTLMKIIAGLLQPDRGELIFKGRPFKPRTPADALRAGIVMIPQELMPFRELSVAENIFIGREPVTGLGWIDKRTMRQETTRLLAQLGLAVQPETRMGSLTVAQTQIVEIAKALAHKCDLLIMDEPTSAISDREAEKLFKIILDLRHRGAGIIYVSHRLDEVIQIADTITVIRDGRVVTSQPKARFDRGALISLMAGRTIEEKGTPTPTPGEIALEVKHLTKGGKFENISFALRHGEILGLAGLMGAGRTELVKTLFGLEQPDHGEVIVRGRIAHPKSPKHALDLGIGLVPEDRQTLGIIHCMSVKHNITLSWLPGPWLNHRAEASVAEEQIQRFSIKVHNREQPVATLSGGNQQKVVLARTLLKRPSILILDEPTRGVDLASKAEIHHFVRRLAYEGMAVLLISSEFSELLTLSTRLLVMRQGRITAELDPKSTTQADVLKYAMPVEPAEPFCSSP